GLDPVAAFTDRSVYMESGQTIILWTKGLLAARNAQRRQYGLERFTQSVEENFARPAADMLRDLWRDLRDFMGQTPQRSPMTLVLIQPAL
ncbi:MAG: SpoIIE family protein phosphatase, partial [Phycisphaerae bacterium]|nr:SpoIIE family protein phosphatase [Phycisphaerae bacterium]